MKTVISGLMLALVAASPAYAAPDQQAAKAAFNWEVKDGQVVRKATNVRRVNNPDGSWREESKEGACTKTVEHGADGSVKTSRSC